MRSANLQGNNRFQDNTLLNQITNIGSYQGGMGNDMNTNSFRKQIIQSQQGAKTNNKKSFLQLQQQNQRLQQVQLLQKQQQQKKKLNQIQRNQLLSTYTANNEQNALFNKLKSNQKKNLKHSNTFRKSDVEKNGSGNLISNTYGLYDYDVDYYDVG